MTEMLRNGPHTSSLQNALSVTLFCPVSSRHRPRQCPCYGRVDAPAYTSVSVRACTAVGPGQASALAMCDSQPVKAARVQHSRGWQAETQRPWPRRRWPACPVGAHRSGGVQPGPGQRGPWVSASGPTQRASCDPCSSMQTGRAHWGNVFAQ